MTPCVPHPLFRTLAWIATSLPLLGITACGQEPPPPVGAAPAVTQSAAPPRQAATPQGPATVTGTEANKALATRVQQALVARKVPHAHSIDVDANGSVVRLFGAVDSQSERDLAAEITAAVEGVETVENKLVIASGS